MYNWVTRVAKKGQGIVWVPHVAYEIEEAQRMGIEYIGWKDGLRTLHEWVLSNDGVVVKVRKRYYCKKLLAGGKRGYGIIAYTDLGQCSNSNNTFKVRDNLTRTKRGGFRQTKHMRRWSGTKAGKHWIRQYVAMYVRSRSMEGRALKPREMEAMAELLLLTLGNSFGKMKVDEYRKKHGTVIPIMKKYLQYPEVKVAIAKEFEALYKEKGMSAGSVVDLIQESVSMARKKADPKSMLQAASMMIGLLDMVPREEKQDKSLYLPQTDDLDFIRKQLDAIPQQPMITPGQQLVQENSAVFEVLEDK